MCHILWMTGRSAEALTFGENAPALAESLGDVRLHVVGNLYLGATCMWMGNFRRAEDLFLKVVQWLEGGLSQERFGLTAFPAMAVRSFLTLMFRWLIVEGSWSQSRASQQSWTAAGKGSSGASLKSS